MTLSTKVKATACSLAAIGILTAVMTSPGLAQGISYRNMSCGELWYERNLIYAEKGYCFKTRRAQRTFGLRCYPPFGRLSAYESRLVQEIKRWERRKGCR